MLKNTRRKQAELIFRLDQSNPLGCKADVAQIFCKNASSKVPTRKIPRYAGLENLSLQNPQKY